MTDKTFITKVVVTEEGDFALLITEELKAELNLKVNEVWKWTVGGDNLNIKRTRLIDNLITKVAEST